MTAHRANPPIVLSFVSGKGGVGKTMLAVAAANELSHARATLILDLDFFNRGLSGMFIQGENLHKVKPPPFVESAHEDGWNAKQIADNLYTVAFPDITAFETTSVNSESLKKLANSLQSWIRYLCDRLNCDTVVLDCHGGPDALSFAAVSVADETLLISEPDRVTMYGTLHFLRTLRGLGVRHARVNLVFNKIVESVGPNFLWRLYKTYLTGYFEDKSLLAAFPLELYLTKSFENNPLVTEDYPQSMLARKTQVMLVDLLGDKGDGRVPDRAKSVPNWLAHYTRRFFGRPPKLLTVNFLAVVGFALLLMLVGVEALSGVYRDARREMRNEHEHVVQLFVQERGSPELAEAFSSSSFLVMRFSNSLLEEHIQDQTERMYRNEMFSERGVVEDILGQELSEQLRDLLEELKTATRKFGPEAVRLFSAIEMLSHVGESLQKVILIWAALAASALIVAWTNYLDREGTVLLRRRQLTRGMGLFSLQFLLWAAVVIFLSGRAYAIIEEVGDRRDEDILFFAGILFGVMLIAVAIWIWQGYRGYRDLKYSGQVKGGVVRLLGAVLVIGGVIFVGMSGL